MMIPMDQVAFLILKKALGEHNKKGTLICLEKKKIRHSENKRLVIK